MVSAAILSSPRRVRLLLRPLWPSCSSVVRMIAAEPLQGRVQAGWPGSTPDPSERTLLEGPHTRRHELQQALRIFAECIRGFRALHFVGPCVTVFGSARFAEGHPYYGLGEEIGERLALAGLTVVTGGGPGLMEAANRGAKRAGGRSIGCNILLPKEQRPNAYLDRMVEFRYFFVREINAGEVLVRVRRVAGWPRNARRVVRDRRFDSDRQSEAIPARVAGCRFPGVRSSPCCGIDSSQPPPSIAKTSIGS